MSKGLKAITATAQSLLVFGAFAAYKLAGNYAIQRQYAEPLRDIVIKLNFPLLVLWFPVFSLMERLSSSLNPSHLATKLTGLFSLALAVLFSVALFWYCCVAELELRFRGKSHIRFSNWLAETTKAVLLFFVGLGAFIYAYQSTQWLLLPGRSKVDALMGGTLLVAWGFICVGISIYDLGIFVRNRGNHSASGSAGVSVGGRN